MRLCSKNTDPQAPAESRPRAGHALSALDIEMLKAGGKLNYIKNKQ